MKGARGFTLLVPVYEEAPDLPDALERIDAALEGRTDQVELLFVDDASTDDSAVLLQGYVASRPHARVLVHQEHRGMHSALRTGLAHVRTSEVVMMEAHAPHDVSVIFELVDLLDDGVDLVSVRRTRRADPAWRLLGSWAVNAALSFLLPIPVGDIGCILKAWRTDAARAVWGGSDFASMLAVLARLEGVEVIVPHPLPRRGRSGFVPGTLVRTAVRLLGAALAARRETRTRTAPSA
ncbi:MAG: glycosyltransferase family 2 protein [Myxococcota bacterium]